ncbi:hypothetical protein JCM10207_007328 [Rhodosporidiobolus poonsookiae]
MPPRQRVADIPVGGEASPSASGLPAAPPSDTRVNFTSASDDPMMMMMMMMDPTSRPSLAGPSGRRASVGAADGPKDRRKSASQRPSWSCTECTRRKIRCDRIVPGCNQCIKRNKVHLCRLDQDVEIGFDLGLSNSSSPTGERRLATVEEYEAITRQANALRLRLYHLERAVQAFIPPSGSNLGGPARPLSSPASRPSGLPQPVDEHVRGATFSEPTFAAPGESVISGSGNDDDDYEGNNSFQLPPLSVQQPSFLPSSASSVLVPPSLAAPPQPQDDEVEAAVSLEFLALGRDSKSTHLHRSELRRSSSDEQDQHLLSASPHKDSAASVHATDASTPAQLASGQPSSPLPDIATSQNLIAYSLDHVKWQHAAVHSGQFSAECAQFYEWGEMREKSVNPAWLALYYAMLCVGIKHLTPSEAAERGYSPEEQKMLAKRWFDASVDALHRANFLAKHSLYSLQTITLFAVSCQDVGGSDLIATLLTAGIRIAQHMSLHRMGSDEDWEAKRRRKGIKPESELGAKLLIEREICKRLWYGLLTEDWISMHFRRAFAVLPLHFDTPVPLNCHDSDLSTGRLVNRPQDEPSDVTKTILLYHVASCMRRYFDHINQTKEMSQANLIEADKMTFQHYRPDFAPLPSSSYATLATASPDTYAGTPICPCGVPCTLRPDGRGRVRAHLASSSASSSSRAVSAAQQAEADTERAARFGDEMVYFWICAAGAQNEGKTRGMWRLLDTKKEQKMVSVDGIKTDEEGNGGESAGHAV